MADISGVGTPITYSEDNPVSQWMSRVRGEFETKRRPPADDAELKLFARWNGFRGRRELDLTVGSACYAYSHFRADLDAEWQFLLMDHARTEAGHGWCFIRQSDAMDPSIDHAQPDPDLTREFGPQVSQAHTNLVSRDFLSYLIAGNLWAYGHCTAMTTISIVTTPKLTDFLENVVQAEERTHHDAILQKLHDYVWSLIERYGFESIRKRISEIDEEALNNCSRLPFDPPRRDFVRQYLGNPVHNLEKFYEWRRYLYLNVLGWEPDPVTIRNWPSDVPVPAQTLAA